MFKQAIENLTKNLISLEEEIKKVDELIFISNKRIVYLLQEFTLASSEVKMEVKKNLSLIRDKEGMEKSISGIKHKLKRCDDVLKMEKKLQGLADEIISSGEVDVYLITDRINMYEDLCLNVKGVLEED